MGSGAHGGDDLSHGHSHGGDGEEVAAGGDAVATPFVATLDPSKEAKDGCAL